MNKLDIMSSFNMVWHHFKRHHFTDKLEKYRTIIIDGCNVAFEHGHRTGFSPLGIKIAVDYFLERGHTRVYALLPRNRQPYGGTLFAEMECSDHLKYTPSRIINKVRETPYDGRFILDAAIATDGIVLTNDQYGELISLDKYAEAINKRLLTYCFDGDKIILSENVGGNNCQSLDNVLKYSKKSLKRFSNKKHQMNKTKYMPQYLKRNNPESRIEKSTETELTVQQINLYKEACDVFPVHETTIKNILLNNPEMTDLNTLVNFVMMMEQ